MEHRYGVIRQAVFFLGVDNASEGAAGELRSLKKIRRHPFNVVLPVKNFLIRQDIIRVFTVISVYSVITIPSILPVCNDYIQANWESMQTNWCVWTVGELHNASSGNVSGRPRTMHKL